MFKKIWVYGAPFSGKTTFACGAKDHYVLSTDGNAQYTTDSYKLITDEVTVTGRITKRKLAWEVLKEEIYENTNEQPVAKKTNNKFLKTSVIFLVILFVIFYHFA